MEQVKLSNFDRLVNIHQSVELNTIKKINKRQLQAQVYQNAQLKHLNSQLSAANEINGQILKNQIKEIEQKETQKFYKNLSYRTHLFLEPIEKIKDPLVKKYFLDRYFEKIKGNLEVSERYLEEINDKLFNREILSRISTLKESYKSLENQYNNSQFSKIDLLIEDLSAQKEKISNFKQPEFNPIDIKIKPKTSVARIVGMLFFGIPGFLFLISTIGLIFEKNHSALIGGIFLLLICLIPFLLILKKNISWGKSYSAYVQNQLQLKQADQEKINKAMTEYQQELDKLNIALLQHPSNITYEQLVKEYSEFEPTILVINELEEKYFPNLEYELVKC